MIFSRLEPSEDHNDYSQVGAELEQPFGTYFVLVCIIIRIVFFNITIMIILRLEPS